jgi:uncharacterized protein YdhG (YjbR/CyaY superfamily)
MQNKTVPVKNVDEYILQFSEKVQASLAKLRNAIKKAAPNAEEVLSYHMPAYKQNGMLLYFAAHKNHIGFYPFISAIKAFKKELSVYEGAKGTVRFPLDKSIPSALVSKIVKFRIKENVEKANLKLVAKKQKK